MTTPACDARARVSNSRIMRDHRFRELQSLALNRAVAARLDANPGAVMTRARATLARWHSIPGVWCVDLEEWSRVLDSADLDEVRSLLVGESERAIRLRQSSPFSVQLSPAERWGILRDTRAA